MAIKIVATEEGERLSAIAVALRALKKGKASPEQQILAHGYYSNLVDTGHKKPSPLIRNVMIARFIALSKTEGENISDKQACREVAEVLGGNTGTYEREFRKWNAQDDEAKHLDYRRFNEQFAATYAALEKYFKFTNE